jgi:hypothetical protein
MHGTEQHGRSGISCSINERMNECFQECVWELNEGSQSFYCMYIDLVAIDSALVFTLCGSKMYIIWSLVIHEYENLLPSFGNNVCFPLLAL